MKNGWLCTIISIVILLLSIPFYYTLVVEVSRGITFSDVNFLALIILIFVSINVILSVMILLRRLKEKRAVLYVQILGIIALVLSLNLMYNSTTHCT
jgi:lipoprotein signal peptidase